MTEFKKGDIIKRKIVTKELPKPLPNGLVTEILEEPNGTCGRTYIIIKNDKMERSTRYAEYFIKASKREAFLYHILGPYISEEE